MYKLLVQMDVDVDQEPIFHEVYDNEHIPMLNEVDGVNSVQRFARQNELVMRLAGEEQTLSFPYEPRFSAVYEIEDLSVLRTKSWAKAVDAGRWSTLVRPFTANRRHTVHKIL